MFEALSSSTRGRLAEGGAHAMRIRKRCSKKKKIGRPSRRERNFGEGGVQGCWAGVGAFLREPCVKKKNSCFRDGGAPRSMGKRGGGALRVGQFENGLIEKREELFKRIKRNH